MARAARLTISELMMQQTLQGKVVVITGASSGIGAAAALALARRGASLVLAARRLDRLAAVAAQVERLGGRAVVQSCDVSRREDIRRLLTMAQDNFASLDVVIANAGFGFSAAVHETTEPQMDEIWRVNVLGTWYVMAEAAAMMIPRRAGHIIVISSAAARRGLPRMGAYSMTKAAQLSLAEAQRIELTGTGVQVSSVHPISTRTNFFAEASRRSGTRVGGIGKMQTAELVGEKIAHLVERPRPELWPFSPARWSLGLATMLPGVTDYFMRRLAPPHAGREK